MITGSSGAAGGGTFGTWAGAAGAVFFLGMVLLLLWWDQGKG
jgi:hypothetical protein